MLTKQNTLALAFCLFASLTAVAQNQPVKPTSTIAPLPRDWADVDGEPVVPILERGADTWTTYSGVRFEMIGQRIDRIVDYIHCPWLIEGASVSLR